MLLSVKPLHFFLPSVENRSDEIKSLCLGKFGVYLIRNELNRFCYIGSALSKTSNSNRLYYRFRNHFYNTAKSSNKNLKEAMETYGIHNFSFHILCFSSQDLVRKDEQAFLNLLNPEYNVLSFVNSSLGYKHSEEIKLKRNSSVERKKRIGNLNEGKSLKDSTKKKLSQKTVERNMCPNFKAKHSLAVKRNSYKWSTSIRVVDATTNEITGFFPSIKKVQEYFNYKVSYRQLKRFLSQNKVIHKLNIKLEYVYLKKKK